MKVNPLFRIFSQLVLFVLLPAVFLVGALVVAEYSNRPGPVGDALSNLDITASIAGVKIFQATDEQTLILFYHPHCPCTRATVRSLRRLSCTFAAPVRILAVAYCPIGESETWIESSYTKTLSTLPNTSVLVDVGGKECKRFGARTSGHFLLYDSQGQLKFNGGITAHRGHEGDCAASIELVNKINSHSGEASHWPVFGCPIVVEESVQP